VTVLRQPALKSEDPRNHSGGQAPFPAVGSTHSTAISGVLQESNWPRMRLAIVPSNAPKGHSVRMDQTQVTP